MLQGDLLFKELSDLLLGAGEDAPERADYMASRDMHAWDSEALQADIQMLKKAVQTRDGVTSGQAEEARRSRRRSRDDSDWDSDEIGGDSDSFNKRRQGHPSSGDGLNVGCAGITARMSWNTSGRDRVRHGGSPGLASSQDVPPTPLAAAALCEAVEHEWSTSEEEGDACLANSRRPVCGDDAPHAAVPVEVEGFIPSQTFTAPRCGYVLRKGPAGALAADDGWLWHGAIGSWRLDGGYVGTWVRGWRVVDGRLAGRRWYDPWRCYRSQA